MLRAMIVDDEGPARSEMRFLLDEVGGVEIVAEADNVRSALNVLKERRCDVLFLDVNMPGVSGMQLAEALTHLKVPPAVVFVTAYGEFATEAFGVNAVDYLMKPVETERLIQAIDKVMLFMRVRSQAPIPERIMVDKQGKKFLINPEDVSLVMAKDDYSYIYSVDGIYIANQSLAQLEERLCDVGFYRVHRTYLVNVAYIKEVDFESERKLSIKVKGYPHEIPVSRRKITTLKRMIDL